MDIKEFKKLGNKIYSISQRIEESEKAGMTTRIPAYLDELDALKLKMETELPKLREYYGK